MRKLLLVFAIVILGLTYCHLSFARPAYIEKCREDERGSICTIRLSDHILDARQYKQLFYQMNNAKPGDVFIYEMQGYGGYVDTLQKFVYHFERTKAKIVMDLVGNVYSAHAFLTISGNYLVVSNRGATLMFHETQTQLLEGVPDWQKRQIEKDFEYWARQHYSQYFYESELKFIFANPLNSITLTSDEMLKRWDIANKR